MAVTCPSTGGDLTPQHSLKFADMLHNGKFVSQAALGLCLASALEPVVSSGLGLAAGEEHRAAWWVDLQF